MDRYVPDPRLGLCRCGTAWLAIPALSAYAELYGQVERKLFAQVASGKSAASLKSEYVKWYGIPARMFNAVRVLLEGKIASVREQQKLRLDGLRRRIARAETQIVQAEQRGRLNQAHHKTASAGEYAAQVDCAGSRHDR